MTFGFAVIAVINVATLANPFCLSFPGIGICSLLPSSSFNSKFCGVLFGTDRSVSSSEYDLQ